MSRNSRRKRAARPWQDPTAIRDLRGMVASPYDTDDELELDGYEVRTVSGDRVAKTYTCPACGNSIGEGEGHVVVWPEHEADLRRHWHTHCWRIEARQSRGIGA